MNKIKQTRTFTGEAKLFWPELAESLLELTNARFVLLMFRDGTAEKSFKAFCRFPEKGDLVMPFDLKSKEFIDLIQKASNSGFENYTDDTTSVIAARMDVNEKDKTCVAVLVSDTINADKLGALKSNLQLVGDTITLYNRQRAFEQAKNDIRYFAETLDIMVQLNIQNRFVAACMTLCNEIASRFNCARVSLGWLKSPYIRLQSISNMESFEKKMNVIQEIEKVMEEALDQDLEIIYPDSEAHTSINREHETFSKKNGISNIVSLPIRVDGIGYGVITLERETGSFSEYDLKGLRILTDQASRRLFDLHKVDRWFGARLVNGARNCFAKLLGFENTWSKLFGLLGVAALLVFIFWRPLYRIEGDFIIRTDKMTHLPAPYNGYISEVPFKVGDNVKNGDVIVRLDDRELLLEQLSAISEIQRYSSEAEKAEAEKKLADMRAVLALKRQSEAKLDMINFRIDRAAIKAPYDSIIVVGDLRDRIGAPVEHGEILMRLTRLEDLYVEIKVGERDIHEIKDFSEGQIAFVSMPDNKYNFKIERIEPIAMPEQDGNVFVIRGKLIDQTEDWWRPGMSGVAKIDVGNRSLFWVFTHRFVDFVRLYMWW